MIAHEYANLFPMLSDSDLQGLADDIAANGLQTPITTLDGAILDGRNRYRACELAGVDPVMEEYQGADPLGFVISHNLHRRHLTEPQRGAVAASIANLHHGQRADSSIELSEAVTQKQAAAMMNVSVATVKRSKSVIDNGIPELADMQRSGEVSASAASEVAKLPEEEQRKAVSGGVAGVKAAAKKSASQKCKTTPSECLDGSGLSTSPSENTPAEKAKRTPNYIPGDALDIWNVAKTHLDRILKNDIHREQALKEVIEYCQNRISNKK